MQLVSVNGGTLHRVTWRGRPVTTAIYKDPVNGQFALRKLNLDGDQHSLPVTWITRFYIGTDYSSRDIAAIKQVLAVAALPDSWKDYFQEGLERTSL